MPCATSASAYNTLAHYHFQTLTSSNDEARKPIYHEGDWLTVEEQTAGRGQRGHTWLGGRGENLLATLLLEPRFLPTQAQFLISQAVALSLCDLLTAHGIEPRIKWTNDIYVGDRKIAGILIEHSLSEGHLNRTIIGIGLNINQLQFDPSLPNPTSMALRTGATFDREAISRELHCALMRRYATLQEGATEAIRQAYCERLYHLNTEQRFRLPAGEEFVGVIRGVEPMGELMVEHPDGSQRGYLFREIEFIITP